VIGLIERYRSRLPVAPTTPIVSIAEGSTPLIPAPRLSEKLGGGRRAFIKFEGMNPTASFKDRGMTLAVTKALEAGNCGIICASTGNTSASAAAYAGRAGLKCWVVLPAGKVAAGKLAQAVMHGAEIVALDGNFDQALEIVVEMAKEPGVELVNSLNPFRIEGQKTKAFEICDELGGPPNTHILPVGNAGNITATWKGYREYHQSGEIGRLPKMVGYQAAGAAPIVLGHPVEAPETLATAIRIGNPASWNGATSAIEESGGWIDSVTDEEIVAAYRWVAAHEGVFCEPASAASIAGLFKSVEAGRDLVPEEGTLVCTLTGHGLKDPDQAVAGVEIPPAIAPNPQLVREQMGLG